jgi:hypothetical protein
MSGGAFAGYGGQTCTSFTISKEAQAAYQKQMNDAYSKTSSPGVTAEDQNPLVAATGPSINTLLKNEKPSDPAR